MDLLHLTVLALVQGITEFLPISSSAHLILVPVVTGAADQGLAFDIALHVGTLGAVIGYFRDQIRRLLVGGIAPVMGRPASADTRLAWLIVLATIPVGLAGLLFKDSVETVLRTPQVIAWASIGFGVLLWVSDRYGPAQRNEGSLGWRGAVTVGLFQALALIPGTSRSGITMTAGRFLGLDRRSAARFAFLLSIPVIALSGMLQAAELVTAAAAPAWRQLALVALLAAVSAWLCIALFLRYIERVGMTPFVIYRIALGGVLLAVL